MKAVSVLIAILTLAACGFAQEGWFQMPEPPGKHINLSADDHRDARTFGPAESAVGTYYFYWYDIHTNAHVTYGDGGDACQDHPPTWDDYSYKSPTWHEREMKDILAAGIDFLAPVYWGCPGDYESWSFAGLPPLVEAWQKMEQAGQSPPQIALFYDTSTLRHNPPNQHIDLTTGDGLNWFYATIRDFWSLLPPKTWARWEGKPIILLYSAAFAAKQNPAAFTYLRERFRRDFGVEPYIVKEVSWQGEADAVYSWGAALGPKLYSVAALGPGYDHSAVRGREPLIVDRKGGQFYEDSWNQLLSRRRSRRASIVMTETWNELHEGTDICHSKEYGRQYIELTRKYADLWKQGVELEPTGPYAQAREVSATLGEGGESKGVQVASSGDGVTRPTTLGGRPCHQTAPNDFGDMRYMYFDVDNSFLWDEESATVEIEVEYWDDGCPSFELHYDNVDATKSIREGAFRSDGGVKIEGSKQWKKATFTLQQVRFADRCNGGDFRFALGGGDLAVASVAVRKR